MCSVKQSNLAHFAGSEQLFYHWAVRRVVYTEGIQYLNANGAAWLVDEIALAQIDPDRPQIKAEEFQAWKLELIPDLKNAAVLTCDDGNGNVVFRKDLDYTDFPFPITIYFENDTICLPSER